MMNYKILEVHQVYQNNQLEEIAVLWQSSEQGPVRASYCTNKPCSGYKYLMPGELLSSKLIQEVAGQGMYLSDAKKKAYFPGKRKWER